MRSGQLVKWSAQWLSGCITCGNLDQYKDQVGIVIEYSTENEACWRVAWSTGEISDVHYDFLVVI